MPSEKPNDLKNLGYENVNEQIEQAEGVYQRFEGLKEPGQIRTENLGDSLKFFEWTSEVDEQLAWMNDKIPQLESTDYGKSLHAAQSLTKKHQILEQEIHTRKPIVQTLIDNGQAMQSQQFAVAEINARLDILLPHMNLLWF